MKAIMKRKKVNFEKLLVIGFDVGKSKNVSYFEFERNDFLFATSDTFANASSSIEEILRKYESIARAKGYEGLCVLCEPSGGYEKRLMRMARQRGHQVFYTSSEATYKAKIIESNDAEKSDEKDPRTIHMLGKMNKVLEAREHKGSRDILRILDRVYERESLKAASVKNEISSIIDEFFPDLGIERKTLYSKSGRALVTEYAVSPWKIIECGYKRFVSTMKRHGVKRITFLSKIWNNAKESTKQSISIEKRRLFEERISVLYEDWERAESRKEEIKLRMQTIASSLPEFQKFDHEDLKSFALVRLIAQLGDLRDFSCHQQIIRYAGINLIRHSSGNMKGKEMVSKKGAALLRKVLYQYCFSKMIKPGQLFHEYFKKKREIDKKAGLVAMVAVMRKVLKMLFGIARSSLPYERSRVTENSGIAA